MVQNTSLLLIIFFSKQNPSFSKFTILLIHKKAAGKIQHGKWIMSVNVDPSSKETIQRTPLMWIKP